MTLARPRLEKRTRFSLEVEALSGKEAGLVPLSLISLERQERLIPRQNRQVLLSLTPSTNCRNPCQV